MTARRWYAATGACLAAGLLVLTGCNSGTPSSAPPPSPTVEPSAAPPPATDSCHRLGYAAAAEPTGGGKQVPCGQAHTAITYYVGSYQPVQDGHLLAVDSSHVQAQLAERCPGLLGGYLGGDQEAVRLSNLEAVWFGPTLTQAERGAHWFRCDVVAPQNGNRLEQLPRSLKNVLADATGRERWGLCGSASPSKPNFRRVACSAKHSWRAIRTVDIGSPRYLAKSATGAGNTTCKDAAGSRANGALKYTWSFQWPSRAEWDSGRRYGYCWIPDAA